METSHADGNLGDRCYNKHGVSPAVVVAIDYKIRACRLIDIRSINIIGKDALFEANISGGGWQGLSEMPPAPSRGKAGMDGTSRCKRGVPHRPSHLGKPHRVGLE